MEREGGGGGGEGGRRGRLLSYPHARRNPANSGLAGNSDCHNNARDDKNMDNEKIIGYGNGRLVDWIWILRHFVDEITVVLWTVWILRQLLGTVAFCLWPGYGY